METPNINAIFFITITALAFFGPIAGIYFFGKHFLKKHNVAKSFFVAAFLFAIPIIAAPLVFYGSLFMDRVKHPELASIAWILVNSYSIWLILGFIGSLKLYGKAPSYISILPSIFSWIFAVAAVFGGLELVNY